MLNETPKTIYLKDYRLPAFLIQRVDLRFELAEDVVRVTSALSVRRNRSMDSAPEGIILDGESLELRSLAVDGRVLSADEFITDEASLTIFQVPDVCVIESVVAIRPQENTSLEGLYRSGSMFCTQCEAEGFRKITWYLDRPDVMARFRTTIVADRARYPVLLSNGNLLHSTELDDGRHLAVWEDPFPKPCYLFALVAGNLSCHRDRFTTASRRDVDLRIFVEPENIAKCDHAMRSLKRAMAWDESVYGREYDLDIFMIVAVNDFNMGAMENKGLNIFNSKAVLASPESATDQDFQRIEGIIAHEYFHNWTGNRITCRDWFQLSLKEGLTVFRDQEFSADMGSRDVKRIEDVRTLRARQFPEDAGPMAHPVRPDAYIEINNFYTLTVYEKGSEVVRMQYSLLGPEAFRRATDLYFERHDGQAVTTEDFVKCVEEASGRDLSQFRRWYSQAGTPELDVTGLYDAARRRFELTIEQSCSPSPGQAGKEPFHIPVAVGLLDAEGRDIPLRLEHETGRTKSTKILELRRPKEVFRFEEIPVRPVPSLLRGFSAPVRVAYDYSDRELIFLMAHDSDGFNRWDAAQRLSQRLLLEMVVEPRREISSAYLDAFLASLADRNRDRALLAETLTLPAESYLGDQMKQIDVEGIHAARERLKFEIAFNLRSELERCILDGREQGTYSLTPEAIGRRRLRNLCLDYLMQLNDRDAWALCEEQYDRGHNMTDVLYAFSLLVSSDSPRREELIRDFHETWRGDPLVMDKWFGVQALSKRADTLSRVQKLTRHPAFTLTNPNKVRSLIGGFCSGNPVRFHARDGEGYRFLGEQVRLLDGLNPQMAAQMMRIFTTWRRYDGDRQKLMKGVIEEVLSIPGISRDLFEIASKSLGDEAA